MSEPITPPVFDNPESAGYLRNLIQALKLHSPDSLGAALGYLHLTGLHLPLLTALAAYNDAVIEHGTGADVDQLESLLSSTIHYVQHRLALAEGRVQPGNALERQVVDPKLEVSRRLAFEYILGSLVSLRIALQKNAHSLAPHLEQIVNGLIDQRAGEAVLAEPHQYQQALTRLRQEIREQNFPSALTTLKSLVTHLESQAAAK